MEYHNARLSIWLDPQIAQKTFQCNSTMLSKYLPGSCRGEQSPPN